MDIFYLDQIYIAKQSKITKLNWRKGLYDHLKKDVVKICARNECKNNFQTKSYNPKKYCSRGCAAIVNNTGRFKIREKRYCNGCGIELKNRSKIKFCSNKCQFKYQYKTWVESWKNGVNNGNKGITTKFLSGHLRRYLFDKYNNKCAKCGWCEKNPVTRTALLEIEHIDGNADNNSEENLILLCPNCHSLTPYYKNLNRGKGRKWRMEKYIKN